jgi:hypothetical protein
MWERGYDGEGRWVDALVVAAHKELDDAAAAVEAARTAALRRRGRGRRKRRRRRRPSRRGRTQRRMGRRTRLARPRARRRSPQRAAGGSAPQCPLGVCSGAWSFWSAGKPGPAGCRLRHLLRCRCAELARRVRVSILACAARASERDRGGANNYLEQVIENSYRRQITG